MSSLEPLNPTFYEGMGQNVQREMRRAHMIGNVLGLAVWEAWFNNSLTTQDSLTGLLNKKGLNQVLIERAQLGKPFGIANLDLNGFKTVNDTLGHGTGDMVLHKLGYFLKMILMRSDDILGRPTDSDTARNGGDEFIILFNVTSANDRRKPATPHENMLKTIRHICKRSNEFLYSDIDLAYLNLSISVGGAVWEPGMSVEDALHQADDQMYRHKRGEIEY